MCRWRMLCSRAPVALSYNPSYSEGRDQEDQSLKPAQANGSWDYLKKKSLHKKKKKMGRVAGKVAQGIAPEFKP
jgi:hypothetical protein